MSSFYKPEWPLHWMADQNSLFSSYITLHYHTKIMHIEHTKKDYAITVQEKFQIVTSVNRPFESIRKCNRPLLDIFVDDDPEQCFHDYTILYHFGLKLGANYIDLSSLYVLSCAYIVLYCKSLWTKASAKCSKCKCYILWVMMTIGNTINITHLCGIISLPKGKLISIDINIKLMAGQTEHKLCSFSRMAHTNANINAMQVQKKYKQEKFWAPDYFLFAIYA